MNPNDNFFKALGERLNNLVINSQTLIEKEYQEESIESSKEDKTPKLKVSIVMEITEHGTLMCNPELKIERKITHKVKDDKPVTGDSKTEE